MCVLAYASFLRISELLCVLTEDLYHKIFVEVSKTDKYREGSCVYIATTRKFICPYTYLNRYLEVARIPSSSQECIFRWYEVDTVH